MFSRHVPLRRSTGEPHSKRLEASTKIYSATSRMSTSASAVTLLGLPLPHVPTAIVDHVSSRSADTGVIFPFITASAYADTFIKDMPGPFIVVDLPTPAPQHRGAATYYPWRDRTRRAPGEVQRAARRRRAFVGLTRDTRLVRRQRLGPSSGHVWRHHDTVRREASQELHEASRRRVIPSLATMSDPWLNVRSAQVEKAPVTASSDTGRVSCCDLTIPFESLA